MALTNDDIRLLRGRYEEQRPAWARLAARLHEVLAEILGSAGVRHLITHRAKSPGSLQDKLGRYRHQYDLSDFDGGFSPPLDDLAAARVLVYLGEDGESVVEAVRRAFLQGGHEVPEPKLRKAKRGYNALHLYPSAEGALLDVPDELGGTPRVEVQVTTLVHHLWNELNHDICYKQVGGRPDEAQKELLECLAAEVHLVLETAERLMARTKERVRRNERPIAGPAELRVHLEDREDDRHPLTGDFQGLFELLNALVDPLTPAWLDGCFRRGLRPHPTRRLRDELDPAGEQGEVGRLLVSLLPSLDARAVIEVVASIDDPSPFYRFAGRAAEAVVRMTEES